MGPGIYQLDRMKGFTTITPFISKTHDLIQAAPKELIEWNADGTGFIIKHPKRLEKELLHKYFKHSNFSSFTRQLSFYGFQKSSRFLWFDSSSKVGTKCCEYRHKNFIRGRVDLMSEIQRKTHGSSDAEEIEETKEKLQTLTSRVDELNSLVQQLMEEEIIFETTAGVPVEKEEINSDEMFKFLLNTM